MQEHDFLRGLIVRVSLIPIRIIKFHVDSRDLLISIAFLCGDMTKPISSSRKLAENSRATPQSWLQLALLRAEKCELKEAQVAFTRALLQAKKTRALALLMEAIAGLLRLSVEAL